MTYRRELGTLLNTETETDLQSLVQTSDTASYFLGICHGAGAIYRLKDGTTIFRLRGDKLDNEFYQKDVFPLAKRYLSENIKLNQDIKERMSKKEKYSVPVLHIASPNVLKIFQEYLGFPIGKKNKYSIPKLILNSNVSSKRFFLKGMIATAGTIMIDKKKDYARVEFRDKPASLLEDIKSCFRSSYGINVSIGKTRASIKNGDAIKLYAEGAIVHPHHLSRFS
ncbi:MAG: hypothetical protein AABW88_02005 [Nanoarchaeota archaeon]